MSLSECNTGLGGGDDGGVDDEVIVGDTGDVDVESVCGVSGGVGCGTGVGSGRDVCDCGEGSRRPRLRERSNRVRCLHPRECS